MELVKKSDPKDLDIVKRWLPTIRSAKQLIATLETLPKFPEDRREKVASGLMLCLQDDSIDVASLIQSEGVLIEGVPLLLFTRRGHRAVLEALQKVSPEEWRSGEESKNCLSRTRRRKSNFSDYRFHC